MPAFQSLSRTIHLGKSCPPWYPNCCLAFKTREQERPILGVFFPFIVLLLLAAVPVQARITYTLSFENRMEHYVSVTLEMDGLQGKEYLDFKMPVWTPGSYLIREFSRNVVDLTARSGVQSLPVTKLDKNTWRVELNRRGRVILSYRVYAFEPDHRSSFVDGDGAMINGASIFLFPDGEESQESQVVIDSPRSWESVTSSLPSIRGSGSALSAPNYDELIDSPIMIGNHTILDFEVGGVLHRFAIDGEGNYDPDRLCEDTGRIIEEIHKVFRSVPYQDYTIFLQLRDEWSGGLEHLNSTHVIASRWTFEPQTDYLKFLMLVGHEIFHAYNIKRLRPSSLESFDYNQENYTTLLWVVEGLTSYYDQLLLLRAGLLTEASYLSLVSDDIKAVESTPGRLSQTLEQASFDAWIKYYRPDENSPNTSVSYYTKGSLVGLALDLSIRAATDGQRQLDDVFRRLWQQYLATGQGYTEEDFRSACEVVAGCPLDDVFRYVSTTDDIDWEPLLEPFGLLLVRDYRDPEEATRAYFGFETREESGRLIVSTIYSGTPAARSGLSVNDELIALDDYRLFDSSVERILDSREQNQPATLLVNRDGMVRTLTISPTEPPYDSVSIVRTANPSSQQEVLYSGWLQGQSE